MDFLPLKLMFDRVSRNGDDSDTALFSELLYAGEFVLKTTTAALVAAIEDDRDNHRYRLVHGLIRADGIGEWSRALDEALTGPASQVLAQDFSAVRRTLTERVPREAWQHTALKLLHEVLTGVIEEDDPVPDRVALRAWFQKFSELRNKTRGHGALTQAKCARLAPKLKESIKIVLDNNPIFELSWAFLHQNLSGKYRVVAMGGDQVPFARLKTTDGASDAHFMDGVYLWVGRPRRVELMQSDLDASDYYFPNGGFRKDTYELHSLITDSRQTGNASDYLTTAGERPPSETEGKGKLDAVGQVFTNVPAGTTGYIPRPALETDIFNALSNDRHPVVTLVGGGGIGKTSLALSVIHRIAEQDRYSVVVWFSARDIDLLMSGAKPVRPQVLTDREIAAEYCTLLGIRSNEDGSKLDPLALMTRHLRNAPLGATLFVFDNFETVRSPVDLYKWIDANIRLPNKALITTRFRDFKADYPIPVTGMEEEEAEALVDATVDILGIKDIVGSRERQQIVTDSHRHPYVIKIMLGEIANAGSFLKPGKLIARKDDILEALFERTFANLSPIAIRLFLMLSGWRSLVPQLAVEAAILRHGDDGADPEAGIDELIRMSLLDRSQSSDGIDVVGMPLSAELFGKKKLEISPLRTVIEDDTRFLQDLGALTESGLARGVGSRLEAFFRRTARKIADGSLDLEKTRPILEFIARGFPKAFMWMADLERELNLIDGVARAGELVRRYLQTRPPANDAREGWRTLIGIYREAGDVVGACGAFLSAAEIERPPIEDVSAVAHWLNNSPTIIQGMDVSRRAALFRPLARLMETYLDEAAATDLSRLAWLHLHAGDTSRAREVAELALKREPGHYFSERIIERLSSV